MVGGLASKILLQGKRIFDFLIEPELIALQLLPVVILRLHILVTTIRIHVNFVAILVNLSSQLKLHTVDVAIWLFYSPTSVFVRLLTRGKRNASRLLV